MKSLLTRFTDLYPVWVISFAILGLLKPETLTWFNGPWVVWALSAVMLGMGFTLTIDDFKRIAQMPGSVATGLLAHYTIMPLLGWGLAHFLQLDAGFAVGLILVACCPSGTASNVICYLARANVALAVIVTLASTLVAFITTPLWCKALAGQYVPVNAWELCFYMLRIAILPILIGVFCNWKFPGSTAKIKPVGPVVSVIALMFITGSIVGQNAQAVIQNYGKLAIAAILLHVLGFLLGYITAKLLRYPEDISRTISIEVGMQNGGLAAVLAKQSFPLHPMATVPSVFSAIAQTLIGSLLGTYWRHRQIKASPNLKTIPADTETEAA